MIDRHNDDRPTFKRTPEQYWLALVQELMEVHEALGTEELGQELADVLIILESLAQATGIDLETETRDKLAFNCVRYPAKDFQTGDYRETRKRIKSGPDYQRIKKEFYSIPKE